jgi:hypothetical protein
MTPLCVVGWRSVARDCVGARMRRGARFHAATPTGAQNLPVALGEPNPHPSPPTPRLRPPRPQQYEEWNDPSGGLLAAVFEACEADEAGSLGGLVDALQGTEFTVDAPGPDGDTAL